MERSHVTPPYGLIRLFGDIIWMVVIILLVARMLWPRHLPSLFGHVKERFWFDHMWKKFWSRVDKQLELGSCPVLSETTIKAGIFGPSRTKKNTQISSWTEWFGNPLCRYRIECLWNSHYINMFYLAYKCINQTTLTSPGRWPSWRQGSSDTTRRPKTVGCIGNSQ